MRKPAFRANRASSTGTRKGRGEQAAARREAILAAALEEFSAQGFAAARLDDVARRANVAKGTIYLHFRDKEELFQELIRSVFTPLIAKLEGMTAQHIPLRMLLGRIIDVFVDEVFSTRRKDVIRLIISEGPRFPKIAEFHYREVLAHVIGALRRVLQQAHDRGEIEHEALVRFPQLLMAPGLVAIVWQGLFDRFEPLDVRSLMHAHLALLFPEPKP
jgi:AcrR family transcriptional regulator